MLRTHTCGELRKKNVGSKVILCGWLHSMREHGNVLFIDLRDRYGRTQIVVGKDLRKEIEKLLRDSVLRICGTVVEKPQPNKKLKTGDIEIQAHKVEILNEAAPLPIEPEDPNISEEARLTYRYIDLRRAYMQSNLETRHKVMLAIQNFLDKEGFLMIETPLLVRHTPEGARDFVVPSRFNKGKFYSLPQSPQLYKQILMVAGMDKYYQLARCLRDENLRQDRQLEFTQLDMEMSFVTEDDIFDVHERLMQYVFKKALGLKLKTPWPHIRYKDAMEKYGSDKPDLRFGLELKDVTTLMQKTDLKAFKETEFVHCLNAQGCADWSRKQIDKLNDLAKTYHTKGIFWYKFGRDGGIAKFISDQTKEELAKAAEAKEGDLLIFIADKWVKSLTALGHIRTEVAKIKDIIPKNQFQFAWIYDFPLFEWDEEEKKWNPMHHIFTMPRKEHMKLLETDPGKVHGYLYDMVLNGVELGSGSIRIHNKEIQQQVLKIIGFSLKDAQDKFGFLMEAFKYGAPPHGGFATGIDRLVTLMVGQEDIREVIAFPKNKKGEGMMEDSPSDLDEEQKKELGICLLDKK